MPRKKTTAKRKTTTTRRRRVGPKQFHSGGSYPSRGKMPRDGPPYFITRDPEQQQKVQPAPEKTLTRKVAEGARDVADIAKSGLEIATAGKRLYDMFDHRKYENRSTSMFVPEAFSTQVQTDPAFRRPPPIIIPPITPQDFTQHRNHRSPATPPLTPETPQGLKRQFSGGGIDLGNKRRQNWISPSPVAVSQGVKRPFSGGGIDLGNKRRHTGIQIAPTASGFREMGREDASAVYPGVRRDAALLAYVRQQGETNRAYDEATGSNRSINNISLI